MFISPTYNSHKHVAEIIHIEVLCRNGRNLIPKFRPMVSMSFIERYNMLKCVYFSPTGKLSEANYKY